MTDFDKLKSILLKDENEELDKIKNELIKIEKSAHSPELIIDKISPLLSSIINKSSVYDKKLLLEAFSPIVLELIDKSYEESSQKVAKQLAPLISIAIKEQIKSHKNEVVDALYPVIGNMISRYVSKTFEEMINSINNQIKNGLSFKVLTRRLKAKIKGVSETDLLLSENMSSNIKSVFLIHKDSGTVLSHVEHPNNPIIEPEMVASMMTAIRSFVNDWVDKNNEFQELGTIEYGGSKILIEASGSSYLAVIIDGSSSLQTSDNIREVLEQITYKYSDEIKNFNGDTKTIPVDEFYAILSTLITQDKKVIEEKRKLHPLVYLLPLLLISYLIYYCYLGFIDKNLSSKANEILYKTSSLTIYRLETKVEANVLTLSGEVPSLYYKQLAEDKLKKIKDIKKINNDLIIVPIQNDPFIIEQKISYLFLALNINKNIDLEYEYNHPSLKVKGSVWSKKDKGYILSQLSNLKEIKHIDDKINIKIPSIDTIIYFDKNSSAIIDSEEYKLIEIITLLQKLDEDLILEIKAYRDETGTKEKNQNIVTKRANNVAKYLKVKGRILQKTDAIGINETPANIDLEKNPQEARQVVFSWKK